MRLRERQKCFLDAIYSPEPRDELRVYRKNFVFNLCGALKETYRFCHKIVGEGNFRFLAREYIYQNPSRSSDVIRYGGAFADFLKARTEIRDLPYLPDIARLEWARERAFYAAEEASLRTEEIAAFISRPPEEVRLTPKRSVSVITTTYRVSGAYQRFLEERWEAPAPGTEHIVVNSERGLVKMTCVGEAEGLLLERLLAGKSMGAVLESQPFRDTPLLFGEALRAIFLNGWLAGGGPG